MNIHNLNLFLLYILGNSFSTYVIFRLMKIFLGKPTRKVAIDYFIYFFIDTCIYFIINIPIINFIKIITFLAFLTKNYNGSIKKKQLQSYLYTY